MFIQTEETTDPSTLKFLPGRLVSKSGVQEFAGPGDAEGTPLAERLFDVDGLRAIAFDTDHVSVTKDDAVPWKTLKPAILGAIMDHFTTPLPDTAAAADSAEAPDPSEGLILDGEVVDQIQDLLDTRIRPVARDQGGDVELVGFHPESGRVHVRIEGGAVSLLGGIQTMLRHYVPEVAEVVNHERWVPHPGIETDEGRAIQDVLDSEINPGVAMHGGQVRLVDVADHTAYLEFGGGCHGCGMVDVTLKQGVETAILQSVPTIVAVMDVTDHTEGENPYYAPGESA